MVDTVEVMVEGGKATAGPPIGPALGPKGVPTAKVVAEINEKTKVFAGMKVPVKILINEDKSFEIKVGIPPMSALIKGELGLEKGSGSAKTTKVGNLTIEQAKKIAEMKEADLLGSTLEARLCEVAGNCVSLGVTIDGKDAKVFTNDIKNGVYAGKL